MTHVWQGLATVRVRRSVDRQGKLSVRGRPLRVGTSWADRQVEVTFNATRHVVIVRDKHDRLIAEKALPWLTAGWIWDHTDEAAAPTRGPVVPQGLDAEGTATLE